MDAKRYGDFVRALELTDVNLNTAVVERNWPERHLPETPKIELKLQPEPAEYKDW